MDECEKQLSNDENQKHYFSEFPLHPLLQQNITSSLGFKEMMPVQIQTIPLFLQHENLCVAAKTGSGKTLAFLVPIIDYLLKNNIQQENGVVALIIANTRELADQTYQIARKLLQGSECTCGLSIGGTNKKQESALLVNGANLLVATPGRLVDHIITTQHWSLDNTAIFVIDEADRILESGFRPQLDEIVHHIPATCQVALFSATLTPEVDSLSRSVFQQLKTSPKYIGVDDNDDISTAKTLKQSYVVIPADKRLRLLIIFLLRNRKRSKIMVFFNTKLSVIFHQKFLNSYLKIQIRAIHGDMSQNQREQSLKDFKADKAGIFFCTDVAARGLDIPSIDWVLQYDPPSSEKDYIHRVGRSARAGAEGNALLFLNENETKFLDLLIASKIPLKKLPLPSEKDLDIEKSIESFLYNNRTLVVSAKEALRAYLMEYESHPLHDCFNIEKLDIIGISKSFGFAEMPALDIRVFEGKKEENWIQKEKAKNHKK